MQQEHTLVLALRHIEDLGNEILELYSLMMVLCLTITRESHHGPESMAGRMHSLVTLRIASTLTRTSRRRYESSRVVPREIQEVHYRVQFVVEYRIALGAPLSVRLQV